MEFASRSRQFPARDPPRRKLSPRTPRLIRRPRRESKPRRAPLAGSRARSRPPSRSPPRSIAEADVSPPSFSSASPLIAPSPCPRPTESACSPCPWSSCTSSAGLAQVYASEAERSRRTRAPVLGVRRCELRRPRAPRGGRHGAPVGRETSRRSRDTRGALARPAAGVHAGHPARRGSRTRIRMIPSRPSVGRDLVPGGGLPGI